LIAQQARWPRPAVLFVIATITLGLGAVWPPLVLITIGIWALLAAAVVLDAGLRGRLGITSLIVGVFGGPLLVTLLSILTLRHVRKVQPRLRPLRRIAVLAAIAGGFVAYELAVRVVPRIGYTAAAPSDALAPRIQRGDRLLISPVALGTISRGELVAIGSFAGTASLHRTGHTIAIGRVVGLPGQWIGASVDGLYLCRTAPDITKPISVAHGCVLPDETSYVTARTPGFGPVHIPLGAYYILADQRSMLNDSRTFGAIPRHAIEGRIVATVWPLSRLAVR
jgi:signal peptidase I